MKHYKFLYKNTIVGAIANSKEEAMNRLITCFSYQYYIRKHKLSNYVLELLNIEEVERSSLILQKTIK